MMIDVVILEDEIPSRNKLKRFLEQLEEPARVVKELDSVESGISYFSQSPKVDLLISDIELLDGNSFEIFEAIDIPCPVIFTTAYNQFWMQAFEGNGIAYLLKPFNFQRFESAWDKYKRLTQSPEDSQQLLGKLQSLLQSQTSQEKTYKKRISVSTTKGSYFLSISEILFFFAENSLVWAMDKQQKRHLLQQPTLKELEEVLDPSQFFRISRSHLLQKQYVMGMERYSKNSVAVKVAATDQLLICSQSATPGFLSWIES